MLEFSGDEPVAVQARLFHAAAFVAGPHGAAFANAIFCRAGASLLEFHRLRWEREANSPLYAQLSRLLGLSHWVLVDSSSTSPSVSPAAAAAAAVSGTLRSGSASTSPLRRLGPNGRPLPVERQGYQIQPQAVVDAARAALAAAEGGGGGGGGGSTLIEIPNYIPEAEEKASILRRQKAVRNW